MWDDRHRILLTHSFIHSSALKTIDMKHFMVLLGEKKISFLNYMCSGNCIKGVLKLFLQLPLPLFPVLRMKIAWDSLMKIHWRRINIIRSMRMIAISTISAVIMHWLNFNAPKVWFLTQNFMCVVVPERCNAENLAIVNFLSRNLLIENKNYLKLFLCCKIWKPVEQLD